VSIILDGENCWEYYPASGVEFLRALYQRLARHPHVRAVRVRDYLEKHPPAERLGNLFAGSWINHNFGIWIGHPACNEAWDLLSQTREALVKREAAGEVRRADLDRAWTELYIAEGSDWFWWFDDRHSSAQDWLFDDLFRKHLQNVYTLVGLEPPAALLKPIGLERRYVQPFTQPTALLDVKLNGRETYFEWINAGVYAPSAGRGTMNMAQGGRVERLYFGFDDKRLLVRLDVHGALGARLADIDAVRLVFVQPAGFELVVEKPAESRPKVRLFCNRVSLSVSGAEAAAEAILEIALPWRSLGVETGAALHFYAELDHEGRPIERVPQEGTIETVVPSRDFELMMWQA
jgi:hypothetical protein